MKTDKFEKRYGIRIDNRQTKKGKMDVILTKDELKEAVQKYIEPKMKHHNIKDVKIRQVKIENKNTMEVIATLEEK